MKKNSGYESEAPLSEFFLEKLLAPFLETFPSARTRNGYRLQILSVCTYFYHARGSRFSFEQLDEEDAKYYFHTYLVRKCEQGELTLRSCKLRLSVCRSFGLYLEEHIPELSGGSITADYYSPFRNLYFQSVEALRTDHVLSYGEIDSLLSALAGHDRQLFLIALLSFRMMLTQEAILSLKKEHFIFLKEPNRTIGMVSFLWRKKQVRRQIPSDILEDVENFVSLRTEGPIFLNKRGNALTPSNLSDLIKKLGKETGFELKLSELRKKGLIDLVAQNPDALEDVEQYTGLSKGMITEYGKALDRIAPDCIADRSSYKILKKEERRL